MLRTLDGRRPSAVTFFAMFSESLCVQRTFREGRGTPALFFTRDVFLRDRYGLSYTHETTTVHVKSACQEREKPTSHSERLDRNGHGNGRTREGAGSAKHWRVCHRGTVADRTTVEATSKPRRSPAKPIEATRSPAKPSRQQRLAAAWIEATAPLVSRSKPLEVTATHRRRYI